MNTRAPRFAGLQAALAKAAAAARASESKPNVRARVAIAKPAAQFSPAAKAMPERHSATAPTAAADDRAWQVPAEIAAQGKIKVEGYRLAFEATTDQLRRMSIIPAAKGRTGSLIAMIAAGASDNEIRSHLATKPTDSQLASSAMWNRAIVAVCGSLAPSAQVADQPAPREAARARMQAVASHTYFLGNERKGLSLLTSRALMPVSARGILKLIAMQNGESRSIDAWAGDVHPSWEAAINAVCT